VSGVVCARGGIGCPMYHDGLEPRYRGDKHLAYIRISGGPCGSAVDHAACAERAQMILDAKDHWRDRAIAAEAEVKRLRMANMSEPGSGSDKLGITQGAHDR
jgi:hypothetical protein